MKYCKLTSQEMTTHNGYSWVIGEWQQATGTDQGPCSNGVLHAYPHPVIAALLNPLHASIQNPRCWEIETDGSIETDGLKAWTAGRMRLVREIHLPNITTEQRVAFAIHLVLDTCIPPETWKTWAQKWLEGRDRSIAAAEAAEATRAAAEATRAAAAFPQKILDAAQKAGIET
jgi:hypothetical protein